jgi:hypothetical protein
MAHGGRPSHPLFTALHPHSRPHPWPPASHRAQPSEARRHAPSPSCARPPRPRLSAAQDKTEAVPYPVIERIVEAELKQPWRSVFDSIDPVPLASASVAQV